MAKPAGGKSSNAGSGCLAVLVVVFCVVALVALFGGNENKQPVSPCASDWTKCANNEDIVNTYSRWTHVQAACQTKATEQARYGEPKWPWLPFEHFYKGTDYVTSGRAVAVEPDAQFQNGFGAMVHSRVLCTYDLRAERVIDVAISPR